MRPTEGGATGVAGPMEGIDPADRTDPAPQRARDVLAARAAPASRAPVAPTGIAASLRGAWRLTRATLHGLQGLVMVLWLFPFLGRPRREAGIRWWSRKMFAMLGIGLDFEGDLRPGAKLLVANHISWLDILAVHAACPEARFVSKAEVRQWPLVNRLVDSARTLYLHRARSRDALRVVHEMAQALQEGDTVAVFPEGTTGTGHGVLPFHANLLQAAISTGTPVQPVVLRFTEPGSPVSAAADYSGDITLLQSMWALARARGIVVRVRVLQPLATRQAERRALAGHLHELIAEALQAQRGV